MIFPLFYSCSTRFACLVFIIVTCLLFFQYWRLHGDTHRVDVLFSHGLALL
jgi:hypothetical protein